MVHVAALWDFEDPAGSEARFRAAEAEAAGAEALVLRTQVARALGLQERYDDALAVLDTIPQLDDPEVRVRHDLERGRVLRSGGDPAQARPWFESAADVAAEAGLEALRVDALHMVALVAAPGEREAITRQALGVARAAEDPEARDWDASLLNNLGMDRADGGDFEGAVALFEEALSARQRIGDADRTRVARWMVAWALRNLGRGEEALAIQRALRAELDAAGEEDPYVDEELDLLTGEHAD